MTAPDPPHWTLNSCFGTFCTIWVDFGRFGCLTRLGAKWARLAQKFVPRSRVGIFCHERTRYTPLDSKHIFCCVLYYLNAYFTTLSAKWAKLVQKFVQRSRVGIFRNVRTWSSLLEPNWCFGAFRTTWVHSGPFGCLTKLDAKWVELVQKFVP